MTILVKDINQGALMSDAALLGELGGELYFSARDENLDGGIWKTDGTPRGLPS